MCIKDELRRSFEENESDHIYEMQLVGYDTRVITKFSEERLKAKDDQKARSAAL